MSEGNFVEMTPHIDEKKTPQDVDDASDTYDTIEFLLKHVPSNNGKWASGHLLPGFTRRRRSLTRTGSGCGHPQAPMTDLFLATIRTTAGRSCCRQTSVLRVLSSADGAADAEADGGFDFGRRTATSLPAGRQPGKHGEGVSEGLQLALQRPDEDDTYDAYCRRATFRGT